MSIETFGEYRGQPVLRARLRSDDIALSLISWGALVQSWEVLGPAGPRQATLGFETFEPYPQYSRSFGIVAGRIANRVRDARFTLDGITYELDRNKGAHHLHGGTLGLGRQVWHMEADERAARLTLTSPDGEMGYPGTVAFTVDVRLDGPTVTFDMTGVPDRATPIALAQHSYYALGGPVDEHVLSVAADRTTVTDGDNVPTGPLAPVAGTAFDFTAPKAIGAIELDTNFCLTSGAPAATLTGRDLALTLATDRPGLQVYTAHDFPQIPVAGLDGVGYGPRAAVALEAQDWPDSVNHDTFPDVIATPERPYRQTTSVTIVPR